MCDSAYDPETGLPVDKSHLECGLPDDLDEALRIMKASWAVIDAEGYDINWADAHSELQRRFYTTVLLARKRRLLDPKLATL